MGRSCCKSKTKLMCPLQKYASMEVPISADRKSKKTRLFIDRRQSSFALPAHTTLGDGSACWFAPPSLSLLGGVEKIDEQQLTPQEQTLPEGAAFTTRRDGDLYFGGNCRGECAGAPVRCS